MDNLFPDDVLQEEETLEVFVPDTPPARGTLTDREVLNISGSVNKKKTSSSILSKDVTLTPSVKKKHTVYDFVTLANVPFNVLPVCTSKLRFLSDRVGRRLVKSVPWRWNEILSSPSVLSVVVTTMFLCVKFVPWKLMPLRSCEMVKYLFCLMWMLYSLCSVSFYLARVCIYRHIRMPGRPKSLSVSTSIIWPSVKNIWYMTSLLLPTFLVFLLLSQKRLLWCYPGIVEKRCKKKKV